MSVETFFVVIDTIAIFGMIIGMSISYFIDKFIENKKIRENELKEFEEYKQYKKTKLYTPITTELNNIDFPNYEEEQPKKNFINHKINEKPKVTQLKQKINSVKLCSFCNHDISEHIKDNKNKFPCYHVLSNDGENEVLCECDNYIQ